MTREEFRTRFRGRLLLLITEAWVCRREEPSAMGLLLDRHHLDCRRLLDEIYDTLTHMEAAQIPENDAKKSQPTRIASGANGITLTNGTNGGLEGRRGVL